jgi:hypothetical protein
MDYYPVHVDGALLIDQELLAYFCLELDKQNGSVPEKIERMTLGEFQQKAHALELGEYIDSHEDLEYDIENMIIGIEFAVHFTGYFDSSRGTHTYKDKHILFISPKKVASLFHAAYSSRDELLNELKVPLRCIQKYLPHDFDYWGKVGRIIGEYTD